MKMKLNHFCLQQTFFQAFGVGYRTRVRGQRLLSVLVSIPPTYFVAIGLKKLDLSIKKCFNIYPVELFLTIVTK